MSTAAGETDVSVALAAPPPDPEVALNAYVCRPAGSVSVRLKVTPVP
jgi:hypothetical protein